MDATLLVDVPRCIGCGKCELACAFGKGAGGAPAASRIHVFRRASERGVPIVCLQCDAAACVEACAFGALARDPESGAVVVDAARCVRCRRCVAACPFGAMAWNEAARQVEKCDLCGGAPRCVPFCPTGALSFRLAAAPAAGRRVA